MSKNNEDVAVTVARIGMRQAIFVALITGVVSMSVLLLKELFLPSVTKSELEQEVKSAQPEWTLFPEIHTTKDEVQDLGDWQMCMLVTVGTSQAIQACTCKLFDDDPSGKFNWRLNVVNLHANGSTRFAANGASKVAG